MRTRYERLCRAASFFVAALIGVITVAVVVQAAQKITTPNAVTIPYSIAPASTTGPLVAIPANRPVFVMGADTNFAGLPPLGTSAGGQAFIAHLTAPTVQTTCVGNDFANGATHSISFSGPCTAFSLDLLGVVSVQAGDSLAVQNGDHAGHTGVLTMIW